MSQLSCDPESGPATVPAPLCGSMRIPEQALHLIRRMRPGLDDAERRTGARRSLGLPADAPVALASV